MPEDVIEHRTQGVRLDGVQDIATLRVAGNLTDVKDGLNIAVVPSFLERVHRGIFQRERGEPRHDRVRQRIDGLSTRIGQFFSAAANRFDHRIETQMPPQPGHRSSFYGEKTAAILGAPFLGSSLGDRPDEQSSLPIFASP